MGDVHGERILRCIVRYPPYLKPCTLHLDARLEDFTQANILSDRESYIKLKICSIVPTTVSKQLLKDAKTLGKVSK